MLMNDDLSCHSDIRKKIEQFWTLSRLFPIWAAFNSLLFVELTPSGQTDVSCNYSGIISSHLKITINVSLVVREVLSKWDAAPQSVDERLTRDVRKVINDFTKEWLQFALLSNNNNERKIQMKDPSTLILDQFSAKLVCFSLSGRCCWSLLAQCNQSLP